MLPKSIGKINHYINDFSGVLNTSIKNKLDTNFKDLGVNNGIQVVTVLFPHREGQELRDIGIELFNSVGIGDKKTNNGLLLLISSEEKKIRIVVGKGLEWVYSNGWCKNIIEGKLRPLLDNGDFESLVKIWYEETLKRSISRPNISFSSLLLSFLSCFFIIPSLLIGVMFFFTNYALYVHIFFIILSIGLLSSKASKLFHKVSISLILVFLLFLLPFNIIGTKILKDYRFCIDNPEICEQRKIEAEKKFCNSRPQSCINQRIDYDSIDYKKYKAEQRSKSSSSSTRSSSSSFNGGGGSTNGAGGGD